MPLAEAGDAFVIGDQQTSAVDSGRYEQPIRRVTLFEMMKLIAPGSHAMAERHSLNTGTFEEARHPRFDRDIQFDPPDIDEQRDLPDGHGTQAYGSAVLPALFDQKPRRCAQAGVAAVEPQSNMSIQ